MRNARKALCGLLALLILALAGCACDQGGVTGGTKAPEDGGQAAEGSVQLLTWANAPTVNFLRALAESFHQAYPSYTLQVTDAPQSEHDQVMQTRLSAGNVDVVSFQQFSKPQEDWNAAAMDKPLWQQYIDEGLLLDLSQEAFMARFTESAKQDNAYNGKNYSMPTSTVAYNGLFYNKTIFEELNLSVPTTWDAFIDLCQAIRDDGRYAVITCGAADQWPLNMFATGIMTSLYGQESEAIGQGIFTGEIKHTDPQILELYAMMDQFASFLEPGVTGVAYSDVPGRFASGKVAMLADGSWQAPTIDAANPDFAYGYFPIPGKTAREDGLPPQFGIKYDLAFAVAANAKNKEGALAFLDYFSTKEVYTDFLNAVGGFTPTQPDITLDNAFLNSLAPGLQKPYVHAEHRLYSPKGVGEYGGNGGFSFFYLKTLGGPFTYEELAQRAEEDFETARKAAASLTGR